MHRALAGLVQLSLGAAWSGRHSGQGADAIEVALTPRSRIVVVNTPHNPTGAVYSKERLPGLSAMLERKGTEFGRQIFILFDETIPPHPPGDRQDGSAFQIANL